MKRRGRNPNENPGVRPVTPIELSEKAPRKRLILAAVLLAVGLFCIGYALVSWLRVDAGFTRIEADSVADSAAGELIFSYDLGRSELSPTAERKALTVLYSAAAREAHALFSEERSFAGVRNLHTVNAHKGEIVTVDAALYKAFSLLEEKGSRLLYMAPLYTDYRNLFSETEDVLAAELDPWKNAEVRAWLAELSAFTADENAIHLELLGENKVRLTVSEAYLAFAEQNGITDFIGLYPVKNAFVVDYIAEKLMENGFTAGNISSFDGFCRNLDSRPISYSMEFFAHVENGVLPLCRMDYSGRRSLVSLRAFPLSAQDGRYYVYGNGEIRHPFLDPADGLCKNSVNSLLAYSEKAGCAETLLSVLPSFTAETLVESSLEGAAEQGIFALWFDGDAVRHTEAEVTLVAYDK